MTNGKTRKGYSSGETPVILDIYENMNLRLLRALDEASGLLFSDLAGLLKIV